MRNVPFLIQREINRIDMAIDPVMFADIYHVREGEDSLATAYRLRGLGDVSRAEDVAISYDNTAKALLLSEGTAHALDTAGALQAGVALLSWIVNATDIYDTDNVLGWECQATIAGHCVLSTPTIKSVYLHQGYRYDYPDSVRDRRFNFVAQSSKVVDSICIGIGNVGGSLPAVVTCELIEVETGGAVGNPASATIAAGAAHAKITLGGAMAARLFGGREYALRVTVTAASNWQSYALAYKATAAWQCAITLSGISQVAADWVIPIANPATGAALGKVALGGQYEHALTGTVVRNLDVGVLPGTTGALGWSSNVPLGTSLTLSALYASNDPAVAAETTTVPAHWTLIAGPYSDGMTVPAYRFFRAVFALASNVARDVSPQLADVSVMFSGAPLTLGTVAGAVTDANGARKITAVRALNSVSASSQSLDPKLKTTMFGEMTLELAPEPEVIALAGMKLRGMRVVIRAGINGVSNTMQFYSGIIRDLAYGAGRYILTLHDPVQIADTSIPNVRHPDWDAVTTYILGALAVSGDKAYRSLQNANLNHAVTDAAWWAEYPSVWVPMTYLAGTHLADIALDLLTNRINLADRYIDANSFEVIKTLRPTRTIIAERTFDKPAKARELLDELALLLEAQWVMREGRLALLADPAPSDPYVDTLTAHDIKEGIEWRRGFADLKNEVMVLSGYSLSGSSEQYNRGQAVVDAQSVQDYRMTSIQEVRDRFGLAAAELASIASNYVAKWKDGRRLIRCNAWFGKLAIEAGDVIRIISAQLPASEPQDLKCMVVQSSLNWAAMTNQITLMEV